MRPRATYANVVSSLALFLVLTGGAAYALDGSNTVFSDDIVNDEVRSADLRDGNITTPDFRTDSVISGKIADGEVRSADVLNDSLTPTDIADVGFLRAHTSRLEDPTAGGSADGEPMMTIGRVGLNGFCSQNANGTLTAGISPRVDEAGAVLVAGDDAVELVPFDVQFVVLVGNAADFAARQNSFAILDNGATSATGVAAATVDPDTDRCVISVQAAG